MKLLVSSHLSHTGIVCFMCIQTVHHHLSQGEILLWAPQKNIKSYYTRKQVHVRTESEGASVLAVADGWVFLQCVTECGDLLGHGLHHPGPVIQISLSRAVESVEGTGVVQNEHLQQKQSVLETTRNSCNTHHHITCRCLRSASTSLNKSILVLQECIQLIKSNSKDMFLYNFKDFYSKNPKQWYHDFHKKIKKQCISVFKTDNNKTCFLIIISQ